MLLDPAEKPERILIMDNADKAKARNVWQWNKQGFGFSSNGINGPYDTAITMDGKIVASFILAKTMLADRIKGGTLTLGGQDNSNAVLKITDKNGIVIGSWDNTGIHVKSGEISAGVIKGDVLNLGGNNNANGVLKMVDSSGGEIGFWDNTGIHVKSGTIEGTKIESEASNGTSGIRIIEDVYKRQFFCYR